MVLFPQDFRSLGAPDNPEALSLPGQEKPRSQVGEMMAAPQSTSAQQTPSGKPPPAEGGQSPHNTRNEQSMAVVSCEQHRGHGSLQPPHPPPRHTADCSSTVVKSAVGTDGLSILRSPFSQSHSLESAHGKSVS